MQGRAVFTHGINFSVMPAQGQGLQASTNQMINAWLQGNPNMRQIGRAQGSNSNRRYWLSTRFSNRNEATGETEVVALFATQLSNDNVLFISTVMPQNDAGNFQAAFSRILNSLQINE